jgi:putative acetyltransferase
VIRPERSGDEAAIAALTTQAFATAPHAGGNEARIIDALRAAGALTISLVAEKDGAIIGHAAFSPVHIDGATGWFGLGPVSVAPTHQRQGIADALIRLGLDLLGKAGASGCVVLGEPAYYGRFGFRADERLTFEGVPPEYFQSLLLSGEMPSGAVEYHESFFVE